MGKEITNVSIDVLKVHPRNAEFFDDISGQDYENFKHSIEEEGIISEIIVAPDMTIISGHQRYKAAKELGIKMVPVRVREDLIDEDKKLKVLLAANFGRSKNNEAKQRKVAVEYVKLCGYKNGEMGNGRKKEAHNGLPTKLSLDEIASQLGTSKANLKRALTIERNLTEPMKQILDDGVISKTVAADVIASLSEEEQNELIASLPSGQKFTQKQIEEKVEAIKKIQKKAEIEVVKAKAAVSKLQKKNFDLRLQQLPNKEDSETKESKKEKSKETSEDDYALTTSGMDKIEIKRAACKTTTYQLVSHCSDIVLKMDNFIKEMAAYDYLSQSFNEIPMATRLEYKKYIGAVKKWADNILETINHTEDIIDVE